MGDIANIDRGDRAKQIFSNDVRVDEVEPCEVRTEKHGKRRSLIGSIRKHFPAVMWCLYMLWCVLTNNYAKTAGQSVLGIPQFRKDFGSAYHGNYVLSAAWQSAYYGAPQAASVFVSRKPGGC